MKTDSINTKILSQLTAVRLLINEADRKAEQAGIQRAFAILNIHDALDWMLQVAYAHPMFGGKKNSKMFLLDYAREVDKKEQGLLDLGNISKVNTLRVNFKHDLIFPDPELTKDLVLWAENQTNTICQRLFQVSLTEIDLVIAIDDDQVKTKIKEADDLFSKGKTNDAFSNLSIAFEMVKYNLQDELEKITGNRPVFRTDLSFSNSFFLHLDQLDRDFARAWDQIVDSIQYLVDMSFINSLGVSISDYFRFQSTSPNAIRTLNGQYRCDITPRVASKIKASEYQKNRDFVIEVALKSQSRAL